MDLTKYLTTKFYTLKNTSFITWKYEIYTSVAYLLPKKPIKIPTITQTLKKYCISEEP